MAVLATDGEFCKRWFLKTAVSFQYQFRLAAVTRDTGGKNRPIETVVTVFVAGRECPAVWFRIKGKRCFEKVLALVKIAIAGKELEMAVERGIKDAARCRYFFEKGRRDLRHGAAHVRAHERFVDARVAFGTGLRANIAGICDGTLIRRGSCWYVVLEAKASQK